MNDSIDVIIRAATDWIPLIQRGHEPFKGWWALPGGRIESGEGILHTVVRELAEELGLELEILSAAQGCYNVKLDDMQGKLRRLKRYKLDPRGGYTTVYASETGFQA